MRDDISISFATFAIQEVFIFEMKTIFLVLLLALPLTAQSRRGGGRRVDNAPKVGEAIPEISAIKLEGEEKVDLSKPDKMTVLIFGSHT